MYCEYEYEHKYECRYLKVEKNSSEIILRIPCNYTLTHGKTYLHTITHAHMHGSGYCCTNTGAHTCNASDRCERATEWTSQRAKEIKQHNTQDLQSQTQQRLTDIDSNAKPTDRPTDRPTARSTIATHNTLCACVLEPRVCLYKCVRACACLSFCLLVNGAIRFRYV